MNLLNWIKEMVVGFFIGIANIIPGVSGGTFLLIFGIYERVITILNNMGPTKLRRGLRLLAEAAASGMNREKRAAFMAFLTDLDLFFLTRILIGAGIAIVILSNVMKWLLANQFSVTYAFFFGLILVSVVIPVRLMKEKKVYHLLFFLLGTGLTIYVAASVNPLDKAKAKSDHYKARYESAAQTAEKAAGSESFTFAGKYSIREYAYAAASGALAVSAMVLPGISGSLVLILLGQYVEVISAVSGLKTLQFDYLVFLSVFALGMGVGILLFARLVKFVFTRYYNQTMAFLTGLMIGSLYSLWPFKKTVCIDQYIKSDGAIEIVKDVVIHTNINQLPPNMGLALAAFVCCLAGIMIMLFFIRKEAGLDTHQS